jgi:hypothetical protein
MPIGEYTGLLAFGIISTGVLAYRPTDLPLFVIGALVFSILIARVINFTYNKIKDTRYNFLILSIIGGIVASIGVIISTKTGIVIKFNGILWLFMGITVMKFNIDHFLE